MFRTACLLTLVITITACGSGSGSSSTSSSTPDPAPTTGAGTTTPTPTTTARHARCGYIGAGDSAGATAFLSDPTRFDAIHPDWWSLTKDGVHLKAYVGADDGDVIAAARTNGVRLEPLIAGVDNPSYILSMLHDPNNRAAHVKELVDLANAHGYDGLEIDYEHQPGTDRPLFTEFMSELATAMHAAGKTVSAAISGDPHDTTVYDYVGLSAVIDHLHIMGYDYHWLGSHSGPTAPLGWIQAVVARAAATGHADKFILAVPNYGLAPGWYGSLTECAAACTGPMSETTTEMESCPFNVDDHYAAGRAPNCNSSHGLLYFDDLGSLEERVAAARAAGIGGIGEWTIGGEPAGFSDMLKRHYP
jgi:spore germination protein YaaH